jgi:gamma-glutamylcyclotransferase (GGCT)/AIG2-like uncharacterized protein YtfP
MKIFCYGTLQDSKVQLELLGKTFIGKVSSIDNYIIVRDYIDPTDGIEYPRIVNFDKGCVYGNIYDFTEEEVKILDEYETSLYFKKEVILNCNTKCLCYFPVI